VKVTLPRLEGQPRKFSFFSKKELLNEDIGWATETRFTLHTYIHMYIQEVEFKIVRNVTQQLADQRLA
jgi:hypothetical protein